MKVTLVAKIQSQGQALYFKLRDVRAGPGSREPACDSLGISLKEDAFFCIPTISQSLLRPGEVKPGELWVTKAKVTA